MSRFKLVGISALLLATVVQFAPLQMAEAKSLRSIVNSAVNAVYGPNYGYSYYNNYGYNPYGYGSGYNGYNPYLGNNYGAYPYGYAAPSRYRNFASIIRDYVGF